MEIFVRTKQNYSGIQGDDVYIDRKLSLFGDEEIELTRNWYNQQIISGYGSWSKTISVPIDANNNEIFKFYDVIGGSMIGYSATTLNTLDPNYLLKARLVINDFEIQGNLQVVGFSMKSMVPFSYQVIFYGGEKNLILDLNASVNHSTLNDIDTTNLEFEFTKENVIKSWSEPNSMWFTPLFAIKRPLNYRNYELSGNTNSTYHDGFRMTDLAVSYNVKKLFETFFNGIVVPGNNGNPLTITHSQNVNNFLQELYIMPNTKIDYTSDITHIHTLNNGYNGLLMLYPGTGTNTGGTFRDNKDTTSWDNINNYLISNNTYTAPRTDKYKITIDFDASGNGLYIIKNFRYVFFQVYDTATNVRIGKVDSKLDKNVVTMDIDLTIGQNIKITVCYVTSPSPLSYYVTNVLFNDKSVSSKIRIERYSSLEYGFKKSTINFPSNVLLSDFFVNFCKTFNIFFLYQKPPGGVEKKITTYFYDELPRNSNLSEQEYDFSRWNILDVDTTFNHQPKYKLVDYQFAEPKDINNIAWYQGKTDIQSSGNTVVANSLWFGQSKNYYTYDVGLDKLEYKSIFTVFPKTTLNKTDSNNIILDDTRIPLHSELNETFNSLNTDYLLMYRNPQMITGLTYKYNLQNSALTFDEMDYCSDYGPYQVNSGGSINYSLDYAQLPLVIKDNVVKRYEGVLEFLLPMNIVYGLTVYDRITVRGIQYEILEMTCNMRTGYSKIKVQTIPINTVKVPVITPELPVATITTTRIPCPTTTTTTTSGPTTTTTTTLAWTTLSAVMYIDPGTKIDSIFLYYTSAYGRTEMSHMIDVTYNQTLPVVAAIGSWYSVLCYWSCPTTSGMSWNDYNLYYCPNTSFNTPNLLVGSSPTPIIIRTISGTTVTTTTTTSTPTTTTTTTSQVNYSYYYDCVGMPIYPYTIGQYFTGGSGYFDYTYTAPYTTEADALSGTFTSIGRYEDDPGQQFVLSLPSGSVGTYWTALRDSNNHSNIISKSINVNCDTTTTTTTNTPTTTTTTTNTTTTTTNTPTTTTTTTTQYYSVGNTISGGTLAYIFNSGDTGYSYDHITGIIAQSTDIDTSTHTWGCSGTTVGASGITLTTGEQNTILIVTGCTTSGIAAELCYNSTLSGYTDWFLPSIDELAKMYQNKVAIGGFNTNAYWSSTESGSTHAWIINFNTGSILNAPKILSEYVRAIRYFNVKTTTVDFSINYICSGGIRIAIQSFTGATSNSYQVSSTYYTSEIDALNGSFMNENYSWLYTTGSNGLFYIAVRDANNTSNIKVKSINVVGC